MFKREAHAGRPTVLPTPDELRAAVSAARWAEIVERSHHRVRIVDAVAERRSAGFGHRAALAEVAPDLHWSTYLNWWRCDQTRAGERWERQLDVRVPPAPVVIPADVCASACALRHAIPGLSCEIARDRLVAQFGEVKGNISPASLKRIWKDAGLSVRRGRRSTPREDVRRLSGGAGLAFIGAAAAETGVIRAIGDAVAARVAEVSAVAAQAAEAEATIQQMADEGIAHLDGVSTPAEADTASPDQGPRGGAVLDAHRDDHGRFTGDYNRAARGPAGPDPRRDADHTKRRRRQLAELSLAQWSAGTIGQKLLAIGTAPLLTERRGFDGLEGPHGAWLEALGGHAYQAATLDKALAEFALADVGAAVWHTHGTFWAQITQPWRESPDAPGWLQFVVYVDATQDPYWTHAYAASAKVSSVNTVMPCLTRVALTGGPGVPLVVETSAGAVSLKKELVPFLDRAAAVLGDGELGRLTVVDAEMGTIPLMTALATRENRSFITVIKGGTAKAARKSNEGSWEAYRERDQIREVNLRFEGHDEGAHDLHLRGIEMIRSGSRNPTTTTFATNAPLAELSTSQTVDAYLSRWPHQEQLFRNGRNGGGMDHTHGYGGEEVTHVGFTTAVEKATKAKERAEKRVEQTAAAEQQAIKLLDNVEPAHRAAARAGLKRASKESSSALRRLHDAEAEQQRQSTKPKEIYVRDTTRDGIVTAAKLTTHMLIEYVLREYFGNLRMEARTFIESIVNLPVTIRTTETETIYEVQDNPRNPKLTSRLRVACAVVTRRKITVDGRTLRFRLVEAGVV